MTLLSILTAVFAGIAALTGAHQMFQWGWRWRLGAWALGVYSTWVWTGHFRSYSSNPRMQKLLRRVFNTCMQPVGFLSRLARSDLQPRIIIDPNPSPADWLDEPSEPEVKALARARRIMAQRDTKRLERYHKRIHKGISCSTCGDRPKEINHLFCSRACSMVDDPHQAPHFCFEHRHNAIESLDPNQASETTSNISISV